MQHDRNITLDIQVEINTCKDTAYAFVIDAMVETVGFALKIIGWFVYAVAALIASVATLMWLEAGDRVGLFFALWIAYAVLPWVLGKIIANVLVSYEEKQLKKI